MGPNAQDPRTAYSQLNPDQRSQVAQAYIQRFQSVNEPQAQQFAQLNPQQVSPDQLAQMHEYAAQKHPGIFGDMMKHPVMTGVLGGFAAYEMDKHLAKR